jgi:uncharacterized glyoxalase superfamily protein PhnB
MAARRKPAKNAASRKKPAAKKASRKAAAKKPAAKRAAPKRSAPQKASVSKRRVPETLRFRSVSAGLTVGDLDKSLAWYRDVAGFHVGELWREEGEVRGAEVMAGAARFYLGQDDWAKGRDRKKGEGLRLHLTTAQNVDEIAAGIKKRGGKLDSEPADMPWGTRAFALTDPDGFKLTISTGD